MELTKGTSIQLTSKVERSSLANEASSKKKKKPTKTNSTKTKNTRKKTTTPSSSYPNEPLTASDFWDSKGRRP